MSEYIKKHKSFFIILAIIIAIASIMVPLLSWVGPDGLERVLGDYGLPEFENFFAPLGIDLGFEGSDIVLRIIGILITTVIALGIFYLISKKEK